MKKNKKKGLISAIALCGITLASSLAFTGCGSSDDDKKVELTNEQAYNLCVKADRKIEYNENDILSNLKIFNASAYEEWDGSSGGWSQVEYYVKYEDQSYLYFPEIIYGEDYGVMVFKSENKYYTCDGWLDSCEFMHIEESYDFLSALQKRYLREESEEIFAKDLKYSDIDEIEYLSDSTKITFIFEIDNEDYVVDYIINEEGLVIEKNTQKTNSDGVDVDNMKYYYGGVSEETKESLKGKIAQAQEAIKEA